MSRHRRRSGRHRKPTRTHLALARCATTVVAAALLFTFALTG